MLLIFRGWTDFEDSLLLVSYDDFFKIGVVCSFVLWCVILWSFGFFMVIVQIFEQLYFLGYLFGIYGGWYRIRVGNLPIIWIFGIPVLVMFFLSCCYTNVEIKEV